MANKPETLDPGPVSWGGVEFVHVRNEETGGEADVPAHLVAHHRARGWEPISTEPSPDDDKKTTTAKRRPTPKEN